MEIQAYIIIPARLHSNRLKKKILLKKTGKYLLIHTLESALKSQYAKNVFIATDSEEVIKKIYPFYKKIYLTPPDLKSGTDRCLFLARKLNLNKDSYIINWQADEPELDAKYVDHLLEILVKKKYKAGTLIAPPDKKYLYDYNTVKVLINKKNEAIFFFRTLPPELLNVIYFHTGLYIYKLSFLDKFSKMESILEKTLHLEQMRLIENGYKILTYLLPAFRKGIDVKEDYEDFVKRSRCRVRLPH